MSGLRAAAAFLTRVPVGAAHGSDADLARSVPWFPVVGALVGLAVAAVYAIASEVLPGTAAAAFAVLAGVALTGAFHEDGLADCADAVGGWTQEQARRILRDPLHGTYGVLALVGTVVLRVAALAALPAAAAAAVLPAAHALGRGAALLAMRIVEPAADDGLGAAYAARATRGGLAAGMALALLIAAAAGWAAVFAVPCAGAAVLLGRWATRKLGGLTGDVLGAIEQCGEILVLAGAAALLGSGIAPVPWLA